MRKVYQIMIILTIFSLFMIPSSVFKAVEKPEPEKKPKPCHGIPFKEVLNESQTGFSEPAQGIINNEDDWCDFWGKLYSFMWPQPPCDTSLINFEKETAVYVALGSRANSCYGVNITCIKKKGKEIEVDYDEIIPGENCTCLSVIVKPVDVVKIKKFEGETEFQRHIKVLDCP